MKANFTTNKRYSGLKFLGIKLGLLEPEPEEYRNLEVEAEEEDDQDQVSREVHLRPDDEEVYHEK